MGEVGGVITKTESVTRKRSEDDDSGNLAKVKQSKTSGKKTGKVNNGGKY